MLILSLSQPLVAQTPIGLSLYPELWQSTWQQPAWLGYDQEFQGGLGLGANYELNSNALSTQDLLLGDGSIEEVDKLRIIGQTSDAYQLSLGAGGNAMAMYRLPGGMPLSVSYRLRSEGGALIPSAQTMELILYGNTPYLGQTLSDENIQAFTQAYHQVGIGTSKTWGEVRLGGRANILMGTQALWVDPFSYTLISDSLGTQLDLSGTYDIAQKESDGLDFGASVDVGISWQIDSNWMVHASALDLGFINWTVNRTQGQFNYQYIGVEITDLVNVSDDLSVDIVDTLQQAIFPDTTIETISQSLGGVVNVGVNWRLADQHQVGLTGTYHLRYTGLANPMPLVQAAYRYDPLTWLSIGINSHVGGVTTWGAGVQLVGRFELGKSAQLQAFYQANNLMGYALEGRGSGLAMQGGIGVLWK